MKTLALTFGFTACLFIGIFIGASTMKQHLSAPIKIDLPEEFMCVVSDEQNKPDTVLIYQSVSNDSLYINFLKH